MDTKRQLVGDMAMPCWYPQYLSGLPVLGVVSGYDLKGHCAVVTSYEPMQKI